MDEEVVQLQNAIINNTDSSCTEESCVWSMKTTLTNDQDNLKSRCKLKCATRYARVAETNYHRKCFHVAIWFGRKSYVEFKEIAESNVVDKIFEPALFVGMSYFQIKNYSEARVWLELALQDINIAIRNNYFSFELRFSWTILCDHLLAVNGNKLCYAHFTKVTMSIFVVGLCQLVLWPYFLWEYFQQEAIITSTEIALTEQTNKLIFYASKFYNHINTIMGKHNYNTWNDYLCILYIFLLLLYTMLYLLCR